MLGYNDFVKFADTDVSFYHYYGSFNFFTYSSTFPNGLKFVHTSGVELLVLLGDSIFVTQLKYKSKFSNGLLWLYDNSLCGFFLDLSKMLHGDFDVFSLSDFIGCFKDI